MEKLESQYSFGEELANSITHGIGIALSVAGLSVLLVFASIYGNAWHIVSCSIYGSTLVMLYTASTLYHSLRSPRVKQVFKVLDHSAIYLLIAGTYTPFTLVSLRGGWGWTIFGLIWGFALCGIVFQVFFVNRFKFAATLIYLLMGWLIVIAIKPMLEVVPRGGLIWLVAGGLSYTVGAVFYLWKKIPFNHPIFHLFVLGGTVCHYFAILFYVVPIRN